MDFENGQIFGYVVLLLLLGWLLYIIYYAIDLYGVNPLKKIERITPSELRLIESYLPPIIELDSADRKKFLKRLVWIRSQKHFVHHNTKVNKAKLELLISASASLLTLGMSNYRFFNSVNRIIIYPSSYYSRIAKQHHIGEYNPRLKLLVFSAEDVLEGYKISDDNQNLVFHEISHALCFETKGRNSWEARRFQLGLRKLNKLLQSDQLLVRLEEDAYFRDYGLTNLIEFFAVATESFIESPNEFYNRYPDLYAIVQSMYNVDFRGKTAT